MHIPLCLVGSLCVHRRDAQRRPWGSLMPTVGAGPSVAYRQVQTERVEGMSRPSSTAGCVTDTYLSTS